MSEEARKLKVLVIGPAGTGKTSLISRYVDDVYSQGYKVTIGVDYALKTVMVANTEIFLQLWDIAGQERFESMMRVYYNKADGALVVCDVTKAKTLASARKWKRDLDSKLINPATGLPVPSVLLLNKIDLLEEKKPDAVTTTLMEDFCRSNNFLKWFPTSAKEGINVPDAIEFLVKEILLQSGEIEKVVEHDPTSFSIDERQPVPPTETRTCCMGSSTTQA